MVFVESNLEEGISLWEPILNLFLGGALIDPVCEFGVIESLITSQNFSLGNIIGC
jgi:hypothetical protein